MKSPEEPCWLAKCSGIFVPGVGSMALFVLCQAAAPRLPRSPVPLAHEPLV